MTPQQVAQGWAPIAHQEIVAKLRQLKVHDTFELINTLKVTIDALSGGDMIKATVMYRYYGIYPDMGVGRGVGGGDTDVNKLIGGTRKPKRWTREIAAQRHRLIELVYEAYANRSGEALAGLIKDVTLKF